MNKDFRSHQAIVQFDIEQLAEMLHMPEGTEIKDVRFGERLDTVEFRVVNQDLPKVMDGNVLPRITYSVTRINGSPDRYESKWFL